jgi:hypothetical protein
MLRTTLRTRMATIVSLIAIITLSTGCASILKGSKSSVDVHSNPPGAEIYINGARVGTAPLQLEMASDKSYKLEVRKAGHMTRTYILESEVGVGWVILDVFAGGLIAVVVDAATGDWHTLSPSEIHATLPPAP